MKQLLIVGSIAIDSIQTPWGSADSVLGGSATYAALGARFWTPVGVVGVVGTDFPERFKKSFRKYGIDGVGFRQVEGKTFRWKGRYNQDLQPTTLYLDLGVFGGFQPRLPDSLKRAPYVFLGNIHPALQWRVLKQLRSPKITACDSRDDWISTQRRGFLKLLKKVDIVFLNDSEVRLLTGLHSLVQATRVLARFGPKVAIVKKGEHGVLAASRDSFFTLPAYPLQKVVDPTGAGDAFAGACLGYLTTHRKVSWEVLCRGVEFGSSVASMTIEDFGPSRLMNATIRDVLKRSRVFRSLTRAIIV
ncbi:MAG: PfkB family carbohydrate kinase [Candidatus Omnitrophica bacterium]|nr:PfkB family carbohydrate kinase [Candidatus Omnitrophota bacterium]